MRELMILVEEKRELPDGTALRFPARALAAVERFAWSERRRRPQASLEIRFSAAERAVWLTLTGPAASAWPPASPPSRARRRRPARRPSAAAPAAAAPAADRAAPAPG